MADIAVADETPTELVPTMGELPVSNSAFYQQPIVTDVAGGSPAALTGGLLSAASTGEATTVAPAPDGEPEPEP